MRTINSERRKILAGGHGRKAFCPLSFQKGWIILAAALAGAAVAAGIYLFAALVLGGKPEYQVFSQYRIYFDKEKCGEIREDYYNAYTWGNHAKTDQVGGFCNGGAAGGNQQGPGKGVRFRGADERCENYALLYITTQDAGLSQEIAEAYVYALWTGLPNPSRGLAGCSAGRWSLQRRCPVQRKL